MDTPEDNQNMQERGHKMNTFLSFLRMTKKEAVTLTHTIGFAQILWRDCRGSRGNVEKPAVWLDLVLGTLLIT